jgi:hypothetical protein
MYVLLLPLVLGVVLSLLILTKADRLWIRLKAVLALLLYAFILGLLYFPSTMPLSSNLTAMMQLGTSFTDAIVYFAGEEWWGQLWLGSAIAGFTIGFTKTRVPVLRDIRQVLDFLVYLGVFGTIAWKMGFIHF